MRVYIHIIVLKSNCDAVTFNVYCYYKVITIVSYLLCANHYVNIYVWLDMLCTGVCMCVRTHFYLSINL